MKTAEQVLEYLIKTAELALRQVDENNKFDQGARSAYHGRIMTYKYLLKEIKEKNI